MVLFDPLDGSSNTDVNMPLGSIFPSSGIRGQINLPVRAISSGRALSKWRQAIFSLARARCWSLPRARGAWIYAGSGDWRVSAVAQSDHHTGPGKVYAANEGNYHKWSGGMQKYIDQLKIKDKATGRPYSGRYSACLVADVHRILLGEASICIPVSWISQRGSSGCCTKRIRWHGSWNRQAEGPAPVPCVSSTWRRSSSISGCH